MQSLIDALNGFKTYLAKGLESVQEGNIDQDRLAFYGVMEDIDPDLFKDYLITNETLRPLIEGILIALNVPEKQRSRYLGEHLSVYEFLLELRDHHKEKNAKIVDFVDFIDEKVNFSWKKNLVGGTLLTLGAESGLAILLSKGAISAIQALVASVSFVPVVGAVYTTAIALYSVYQNYHDKKTSLLHKIQDNLFLLANTGLRFTAYGLLIAAAATTATMPLAAALFVVASAVIVIKEAAGLVRMRMEKNHTIAISNNPTLPEKHHQARHEIEYTKARNQRLIKIATAVLYVALIAVSGFVPGAIFVTAAVFLAAFIVYAIEKKAQSYNNNLMNKRLQSRFEALEQEHDDRPVLQPGNSKNDIATNDNDSAGELSQRASTDSNLGSKPLHDSTVGAVSMQAEAAIVVDQTSCQVNRIDASTGVGEEFHRDGKISHPAKAPDVSAFSRVGLDSAALESTDSSGVSPGLDLTLGTQVFTEEPTLEEDLETDNSALLSVTKQYRSSMAQIKRDGNVTTESVDTEASSIAPF